MATDNPVVGEIVCDEHDYGPEKALVKLSVKKNRLYVHCPGCGLKQQTLPPFQAWIKQNATFHQEWQHLYGNGSKYEGGGQRVEDGQHQKRLENEKREAQQPDKEQEKETPAAKAEQTPEPAKVKKPSLLSRLGKALAEEE